MPPRDDFDADEFWDDLLLVRLAGVAATNAGQGRVPSTGRQMSTLPASLAETSERADWYTR
jgi:hypothetical protein